MITGATSLSPLFLSHGSPMLALTDTPARHFLAGLGRDPAEAARHPCRLRPLGDGDTDGHAVDRNATIHDFQGFPRPLYDPSYPAPGAPDLARTIAGRLTEAGFPTGIDLERGLDHGAWVPPLLAYPEGDIPVLQLSVQTHLAKPARRVSSRRATARPRRRSACSTARGSITGCARWMSNSRARHPGCRNRAGPADRRRGQPTDAEAVIRAALAELDRAEQLARLDNDPTARTLQAVRQARDDLLKISNQTVAAAKAEVEAAHADMARTMVGTIARTAEERLAAMSRWI